MKCPKCGYHSFDHLESCKKCGNGLAEHKAKFNLRSFFTSGSFDAVIPAATSAAVAGEADDFDFQTGEEAQAASTASALSLDDDSQTLSIDQPFGVDRESVPADTFETDSDSFAEDDFDKDSDFNF